VLPESPRASLRRAWPGALAAVAGIVLVRLATVAYFSLFGDARAIYGTMGALLAVVFSAYPSTMGSRTLSSLRTVEKAQTNNSSPAGKDITR
jgi:hypothetical protein